jgi:hypothetical protein
MNVTNLYLKKTDGKGPEGKRLEKKGKLGRKKENWEEKRRNQTEMSAIYAFCKLKPQISCSSGLILRVKSENFRVLVLIQSYFR